jgi:hypothetical protein
MRTFFSRIFSKVHVRESELDRERFRDLLFRCEVHAHEHDAQGFARLLVVRQRQLQIAFRDEARLNQALTNLLAHATLTITP